MNQQTVIYKHHSNKAMSSYYYMLGILILKSLFRVSLCFLFSVLCLLHTL